jgi:hypothetical protein
MRNVSRAKTRHKTCGYAKEPFRQEVAEGGEGILSPVLLNVMTVGCLPKAKLP